MTRTVELTAPASAETSAAASAATSADLEREFQRLAALWHEETGAYSVVAQKLAHPAHRQIIALGPAVVPLILRDLQGEGGHWFTALRTLTGEDPTQPGSNYEKAAAAWL